LAKISFSVLGYEFQSGVHSIEHMYLTAHEALWVQKDFRKQQLEAARDGNLSDVFGPENGTYSSEAVLEHEIQGIENSLQLLRQSTLLMFYHFWEKQVLYWARLANIKPRSVKDHSSYIKFCKALKLPVDVSSLGLLRLIANVIKHGQGDRTWADQLSSTRSDLFVGDVVKSSYPVDHLWLPHELVFELSNALEFSGPMTFSDFNPATALDMIS
jgi:hypothetical protein